MSNDPYIEIAVRDAQVDDYIDLQDDPYAAPDDREHIFPYEMSLIEEIVIETEDCIVIHFNNTSIGFPPDHKLKKFVP